MATRELIDIILRLRKEGTAVKDVQKELDGLEDSGKKAKLSFDGIGKAIGMAGAAAGVAATAFYTLKKAYDFGKEGAAIAQTAESFDRLMDSMGVAPGILQRLRDASRGTVDDMTLMSSTLALLAGTSEEVGGAIMEAAPHLLEIASAAHKLNPELGDTAYLYKSLALGIKRASPMILDNLGLTIKVGEATEAYAKTLGKTSEELTAEERQMALLNGALEAGNRLIEQVGGNTATMGDSFAQAEVRIKNATDTLKTKAAPIISEVVGFLADMVDGEERVAEASEEIRKSAGNYDEYLEAVLRAAEANHQLSGSDIEHIKRQAELGEEYHNTVSAMGILTEAQWNMARETDRVSEKWATYAQALREDAQPAVKDLSLDTEDLAGNVDLVAQMMSDRAVKAAEDFKGSMDLLAMAIRGEVGEAIAEHQQNLADLEQQLKDGELTQKEYNAAVEAEAAAFEENNYQLAFNIAQKQILDALEKDLIEDTNASGTAFDEANDILWTLAETLGLTDEATLAFQEKVQDLTGAVIDGRYNTDEYANAMRTLGDGARSASSDVDKVGASVRNLPASKTINIHTNYTQSGYPTQNAGSPGQTTQTPQMYQHGGQFVVRGAAGPDRVPVRFMATRGEVVTITPAGDTPPPNPAVTNNYNLNVTSTQPSAGIVNDFNIMQAMAG